MRTLTFRFVIALAAFILGTSISLYFYQQSTRLSSYSEKDKKPLAINQNPKTDEAQTNELICKDKTIRLVWDELKKDLFGWRDIESGTNCADYLNIDQITDLNNDGMKEIFVSRRDICADGSCTNIWILQEQTDGKFKVIVSDTDTSVEIKKNRTKGYYDLQIRFHYPLGDSYSNKLYQYDGEQYVGIKCWEEIHSTKDKNGNFKKLKTPKILPLHCC